MLRKIWPPLALHRCGCDSRAPAPQPVHAILPHRLSFKSLIPHPLNPRVLDMRINVRHGTPVATDRISLAVFWNRFTLQHAPV